MQSILAERATGARAAEATIKTLIEKTQIQKANYKMSSSKVSRECSNRILNAVEWRFTAIVNKKKGRE